MSNPKEAPKEEVKKVTPLTTPAEESRPQILLSPADVYIHDRMKSQPRNLEEVSLRVEEKSVPGRHRLSLPEDLSPYEKKFAFKWLFKRKQAIDDACDVKGWMLVNKLYFPDLPNFLFTANGSLERGDSILAFMPREKAEQIRRKPGELSRAALNARFNAHKEDPNYYTPAGEEKGERVIGI